MPQNPLAVANHLLRAGKEYDAPLSNMKLQKLMYYAHGWWYAIEGEGLLDEAVQAWDWGPVVYSVYNEFKRFGRGLITGRGADAGGNALRLAQYGEGRDIRKFLEALTWINREKSATDLVEETHSHGTPWRRVFDRNGGRLSNFEQIPEKYIEEYFRSPERHAELRRIRRVMRNLEEQE